MARLPANVVLIVNPESGGGRGARVMRESLPIWREHGINPEVVVSRSGAEPSHLARTAAHGGADLVVALGGDGHIAAVGEGLVGASATMAILPAGSANDYARTIGIPIKNTRAAVAAILDGRSVEVDVMRVAMADSERIFLNVVGTGFDAEVAAAAERITIMRGAGRYVLAMMRVLPRFKATTIRLTIDGVAHEQRAMLIAIANGPAYGGGMKVAPAATLTSGQLEICIVGDLSKRGFVRAFPRVFRGTHVDHPAVTMLHGREISIDAERPLELIGDGERAGRVPAVVNVLPGAIKMVVGKESKT